MVDFIEGIGYTFVEVNGTPCLKILNGDFSDVIYSYSDVSMSENVDEDSYEELPAMLSFSFDVIDPVGYTDEEFETLEFKNKIGDILLSILKQSKENTIGPKQINFEESSL